MEESAIKYFFGTDTASVEHPVRRSQAFLQGQEAYFNGQPADSPFPTGSPEDLDWREGRQQGWGTMQW